MRALGEYAVSRGELEGQADISGRERDLGTCELAVELVARFRAGILRELDGTRALPAVGSCGREQHGDRGRGGRVECRRTVKLLEPRQRRLGAKLHEIDRCDHGRAAGGEVAELASHARRQGRARQLGRKRGLTAQDLELGEIELARSAPSSSPRSRLARTRS